MDISFFFICVDDIRPREGHCTQVHIHRIQYINNVYTHSPNVPFFLSFVDVIVRAYAWTRGLIYGARTRPESVRTRM